MFANPYPQFQKHPLEEFDDRTQAISDLAREFKYTKAGIWDVFEQIPVSKFNVNIPGMSKLSRQFEFVGDLPFVWRMVKDVIKINSCWYYLSLFTLAKLLAALEPAVALWFYGHYLTLVQVAMDERRVDEELLIFASAGRLGCAVARAFLDNWDYNLQLPLDQLMKEHFEKNVVGVSADLDLPTFQDKVVQGKLEATSGAQYGRHGIAWEALSSIIGLISAAIRLVAELCVLANIVGSQKDGATFAMMHIFQELFRFLLTPNWTFSHTSAWVAVTNNRNYVRLNGLRALVSNPNHKQEIVAGNLAEFIKVAYHRAYSHVSGKCASYREVMLGRETGGFQHLASTLVPNSIGEVAEAAYLLRAAVRPATIPACLMIIKLIQTSTRDFISALWMMSYQAQTLGEQFHKVRQLYEIHEIENKIPDGTEAFPGDGQSLMSGFSIEFQNVSFCYPGSEIFALRDVSFKIEEGQLCVIVGASGSGKSTVLKLMLRLYDPTEGTILVNGQDIKTFKLSDLRESMAVLFQDYTHFPLTIRDNIALGDPQNAHDEARIRAAARLAGAEDFIYRLPEGFDTYLDRPVRDTWYIPSNAKTKSGRKLDYELIREIIGGVGNKDTIRLSGGQMQKLAVARMFMRAVLSEEERVGMLLFDEPSAALDPTAEHDLFARIQTLRGEKTMIFSSHRFGQLTKPADLILCMCHSTILESGTHAELMAKEGMYAELWKLQAQAFL